MKYYFILTAFIFSLHGNTQDIDTSQLNLFIDIQKTESEILFLPTLVDAIGGQEFSYNFLLINRSKSGSNTNKQGGKITTQKDVSNVLSQVKIKLPDGETEFEAKLFLYYNGNPILAVSKSLTSSSEITDQSNLTEKFLDDNKVANDDFSIGGIVLDNTKTKSGREFYELVFRQLNSFDLIKENKIMVDETIIQARRTKADVYVDDQLVFSSMLSLKYDELEELAGNAIAYISNYYQNQELMQNRLQEETQY